MSECPECHNQFVQPFVCTTCGAAKLYDATVTSLQARNDALRARVAEFRQVLVDVMNSCVFDMNDPEEFALYERAYALTQTVPSAGAAQHPTTKERCAFDGGLVNRCDEDRCVQSGECQIRKGRTGLRQEPVR